MQPPPCHLQMPLDHSLIPLLAFSPDRSLHDGRCVARKEQEEAPAGMRSTMHSLLVLLLCSFCVRAEIAMQPDFDLQKFAGMWHIMAGTSNCPVFQGMKSIMTTSAALVKPLPSGDMKILTGYPFPEECKKVEMYFKKADQPGHFTNDENAKRDMRVLETDYTNFALLYTFKEVENEPSSTTVQLYTRTQDISNEVLEKFKEHYHKVGLTDDLMVILPKSDVCYKLLSA